MLDMAYKPYIAVALLMNIIAQSMLIAKDNFTQMERDRPAFALLISKPPREIKQSICVHSLTSRLTAWIQAGKPMPVTAISHRRDGTMIIGKANAYGSQNQ